MPFTVITLQEPMPSAVIVFLITSLDKGGVRLTSSKRYRLPPFGQTRTGFGDVIIIVNRCLMVWKHSQVLSFSPQVPANAQTGPSSKLSHCVPVRHFVGA